MSQVTIEIPYVFVQAAVYSVIVYSMIGFEWSAAKFFWYLFFMYFTLLYYTFYGKMIVAVTPNHQISSIASSAFYGVWNLLSGFTVPLTVSTILFSVYINTPQSLNYFHFSFLICLHGQKQRIPIWWRWYYWACPVAWTWYGLVTSQFGDVKDMLENGKTVEDFVTSYFRFKQDFLGVVAVVVAGFAVFFAFIFAFAIMVFNFQRR